MDSSQIVPIEHGFEEGYDATVIVVKIDDYEENKCYLNVRNC